MASNVTGLTECDCRKTAALAGVRNGVLVFWEAAGDKGLLPWDLTALLFSPAPHSCRLQLLENLMCTMLGVTID